MSLSDYGQIVQGIACYRQRIDIALRTTKGTDPLRPLFGTTIYENIDSNVDRFVPLAKSEIVFAFAKWLPEITLQNVSHTVNMNGAVLLNVEAVYPEGIADTIVYEYGNGLFENVTNKKLTVKGILPNNPNAWRYTVNMLLDGNSVAPLMPVGGFGTVQQMFVWIQNNWTYVADWVLLPTAIVGQVKSLVYNNAVLQIGLAASTQIRVAVPDLNAGQGYQLTLQPSSEEEGIIADPIFYTISDMLSWVLSNWGSYGSWEMVITEGDFNGDFNPDFAIKQQFLTLITSVYTTAVLSINIMD